RKWHISRRCTQRLNAAACWNSLNPGNAHARLGEARTVLLLHHQGTTTDCTLSCLHSSSCGLCESRVIECRSASGSNKCKFVFPRACSAERSAQENNKCQNSRDAERITRFCDLSLHTCPINVSHRDKHLPLPQ